MPEQMQTVNAESSSTQVSDSAHVDAVLKEARSKYYGLPTHLQKPFRSYTAEEKREYQAIRREQRKARTALQIEPVSEKVADKPLETLIDETAAQSIGAIISPVLDFFKNGLGFSPDELQTFGKAWQPLLNRLANQIGATGETSLIAVWLAGYAAKRIPLFTVKKNVHSDSRGTEIGQDDIRANGNFAATFKGGDI